MTIQTYRPRIPTFTVIAGNDPEVLFSYLSERFLVGLRGVTYQKTWNYPIAEVSLQLIEDGPYLSTRDKYVVISDRGEIEIQSQEEFFEWRRAFERYDENEISDQVIDRIMKRNSLPSNG